MGTTPPDETRPDANGAELNAVCPAAPLLTALAGQWKTQLLHVLGERGPRRFGALRRILPAISPKMLTQRLRELEADALIWREQEPTIPPKVTYGLTGHGRAVHGVLLGLEPVAADWRAEHGGEGDREA